MKDKYLLLPIVTKSDFLYIKLGITPNLITLINHFVITTFLLFFWLTNKNGFALIFIILRVILDGCDGYIARKYKLISKEGEIYDHVFDCYFITTTMVIFIMKIGVPIEINLIISNIVFGITLMFCFSCMLKKISIRITGLDGSYDGYCTVLNIIMHLIIVSF